MKIHKLKNSRVQKVQQEQRRREETRHEKKHQETSLPALQGYLPLSVSLPNIHRAAAGQWDESLQMVTESQGGTCKADDLCSRRSKYRQAAESTAQRSSLQIWTALCTSQEFWRFEKWSRDSRAIKVWRLKQSGQLSVSYTIRSVNQGLQHSPKLSFLEWPAGQESQGISSLFPRRKGKGHLLLSCNS